MSLLVVCSSGKLESTINTISRVTKYHAILGLPIMDVKRLYHQKPQDVEAIFLTSAIPTAYIQHDGLPTYCVGAGTAVRAQEVGFNVVYNGYGGAREMARELSIMNHIPKRFWHPTTESADTGWYEELPDVSISTSFVYTQEMTKDIPINVLVNFHEVRDVLLLSANGAEHFCKLASEHNLDVSKKRCIAISKQVLDAVSLPFGKTVTLPAATLSTFQQIK